MAATDQLGNKEMNESEPLMTCRNRLNDVKTVGSDVLTGQVQQEYLKRAVQHPALKWRDFDPGFGMEHGKLR
jgi:hypothetical protein